MAERERVEEREREREREEETMQSLKILSFYQKNYIKMWKTDLTEIWQRTKELHTHNQREKEKEIKRKR